MNSVVFRLIFGMFINIFHTRTGTERIFPNTVWLRSCLGMAKYKEMQMVRNRHHHLIYQDSEKNNENTVMKMDQAKAPTTSMERGIRACWMVLLI